MDYKEKYEKALEWMKSIYPTMQGSDKEDAEHYFPELALSEDEKIRKVLIHIVKSACSKYGIKYIGDKITEEMLLAYIERQKEQKPVENSGKELLYVSNKSYNIGYRDGKREAEQKTAEWSEEEEEKINNISEIIEHCISIPYSGGTLTLNKEYKKELQYFLKSLRPQPKQEWSEEDENTIQEIIGCIEQARADSHLSEDHCLRLETFLYKHYRPSWKPSEAQMYSLGSVVNGAGEATEGSIAYHLKELYNQLEKLVR